MRLRFLAALAFSFLITATGSYSQTPALQTLRLASSPVDDVMPVLYAERAGLFRRVGLHVVLEHASSGAAVAAAVSGGAVDIGKSSLMAIINAHVHGVPLVLVAPASISNMLSPDGAVAVAVNSPARTARDLAGGTVAVPALNDLNTLATKAWIEKSGGDWHAVQFLEIPQPSMLPALDQGRVRAATLVKPFLSDAVATGKVRVIGNMYGAIADDFLQSGWFTTKDYVERHRDVIAKFQRVVAAASAYTNTHNQQTVDLLAAWSGVDTQTAAHIPRMTTGTILEPREVQPVIDVAAKYGAIPATFNARDIIAH